MNQNESRPNAFDGMENANEVVAEKLTDAMTPGFKAEFDPEEAERVGAFTEDALSESDAFESSIDLDDQS